MVDAEGFVDYEPIDEYRVILNVHRHPEFLYTYEVLFCGRPIGSVEAPNRFDADRLAAKKYGALYTSLRY